MLTGLTNLTGKGPPACRVPAAGTCLWQEQRSSSGTACSALPGSSHSFSPYCSQTAKTVSVHQHPIARHHTTHKLQKRQSVFINISHLFTILLTNCKNSSQCSSTADYPDISSPYCSQTAKQSQLPLPFSLTHTHFICMHTNIHTHTHTLTHHLKTHTQTSVRMCTHHTHTLREEEKKKTKDYVPWRDAQEGHLHDQGRQVRRVTQLAHWALLSEWRPDGEQNGDGPLHLHGDLFAFADGV